MNILTPDFEDIAINTMDLIGKGVEVSTATFNDPLLKGYQATLIEDSTSNGVRLSTFIARFPRSILAQINTHRVFSRNSASSRARSIKTTLKEVLEDPYIPLFTTNQKGMSGSFMSEEKRNIATEKWLLGRDRAVQTQLELLLGDLYKETETTEDLINLYHSLYLEKNEDILNTHKQNSNRVIEPYAWHESLISSTEWSNFYELRLDLTGAEPEVYAIAKLMNTIHKNLTPTQREVHQPFSSDQERLTGEDSFQESREQLMISSTEAAQISYKNKATTEKSTAKATLGEKLLENKHMSPFEHIAFTPTALENLKIDFPPEALYSNYNKTWTQLRRLLETRSRH